MTNVSDKSCREKKEDFIFKEFSPENREICGKIWWSQRGHR
jgi:hypothetical protein